ncbi:hypothetical protein WN943_028568 [Citrus x changshan-huyou]
MEYPMTEDCCLKDVSSAYRLKWWLIDRACPCDECFNLTLALARAAICLQIIQPICYTHCIYWDNGHKKVKRESGEGACGTFSSNFKAREKIDGLQVNSKHSQLLDYLSALAHNPFQSVRQNIPATMLQFFLEYRSVVYVKWLSSQQQSLEQLKVVPLSQWSVVWLLRVLTAGLLKTCLLL